MRRGGRPGSLQTRCACGHWRNRSWNHATGVYLGAAYVLTQSYRAIQPFIGGDIGVMSWQRGETRLHPLSAVASAGATWHATRLIRLEAHARVQLQDIYGGLDPLATVGIGAGLCLPWIVCGSPRP